MSAASRVLNDYIRRAKVTPAQFARDVGVDDSTMSRWLNDKGAPRLENVPAIVAASGGQICADDLCSVPGALRSKVEVGTPAPTSTSAPVADDPAA
jgi:DNA-binding transcriptional regulator YdaS (Cro superfamily)